MLLHDLDGSITGELAYVTTLPVRLLKIDGAFVPILLGDAPFQNGHPALC